MYPRAFLGQDAEPYRATGAETPGQCVGRVPGPDYICVDRQWVPMPGAPVPQRREEPPPSPTGPCPEGYVLTPLGSCRPPVEPPPPTEEPPPIVVTDGTIIEWGGCPPGFRDVLDSSYPSGHRCDPIQDETGTPVVPPEEVEKELDRRQREVDWYYATGGGGGATTVTVQAPAVSKAEGAADFLKKWLPIAAAGFFLLRGGGS